MIRAPKGTRAAGYRGPAASYRVSSTERWSAGVWPRRSAGSVAAGGEDLARIHQALGIERGLQPLLEADERGRLLDAEVRGLGETDAVLAAERAAQRDGGAK